MSWTAQPGEPAELDDYRESLWIVPDVRSFLEGVESINLASGGYSIEVTDNDNALLEHDGQAEDDKAGGEADESVRDEDDPERLADDRAPRNWSITPVDAAEEQLATIVDPDQVDANAPRCAYNVQNCDFLRLCPQMPRIVCRWAAARRPDVGQHVRGLLQ
jgi:hypothetical protein